MAAAPQLQLNGPAQRDPGVHGQHVYATIMAQPTAEAIAQQGIEQPVDFDRTAFRETIAAPTAPTLHVQIGMATLRTQGGGCTIYCAVVRLQL